MYIFVHVFMYACINVIHSSVSTVLTLSRTTESTKETTYMKYEFDRISSFDFGIRAYLIISISRISHVFDVEMIIPYYEMTDENYDCSWVISIKKTSFEIGLQSKWDKRRMIFEEVVAMSEGSSLTCFVTDDQWLFSCDRKSRIFRF